MRLRTGDVVLRPADWWIGRGPGRVRTLLGSCVSITAWHAASATGAICHCLLPRVPRTPVVLHAPTAHAADEEPQGDPRYVDAAFRLICDALGARRLPAERCEWKLFGGARMFDGPLGPAGGDIGEQNVAAALALLTASNCRLAAQDVAGRSHREIVFDLRSGSVWSRRATRKAAA